MKRILVVDDDPSLRDLLESRLKANGYDVWKASNGVEAWAMANEHKPDAIVLDMMMPVMDGYQFARETRWQEGMNTIPILVLTARTQTEDMIHSLGIKTFICKPFKPQQLLEAIAACVKNDQGGPYETANINC